MLSVTTYGRLLVRIIGNSISQGEFEYVPISYPVSRRSIQSHSYSSPVNAVRPCRLVSACSGFSKQDSPISRTSRIPPTAVTILDKQFGDDACFMSSFKTADVVGVADGVGGWHRYGIDPSLFSKKLMQTCEMLVKTGRFVPNKPAELLASGYKELLEDKVPTAGSSTACIVALDKNKQSLHTANLGDSGFLVVRKGDIVHRSIEQQHAFNTPYQLAIPPENNPDVLRDSAEDAVTSSFGLELGDIIVTASDGLFDNLSDSVILSELAALKNCEEGSLKRTAWSIAEQALDRAFDPDYMSPFAQQARKNGYASCKGGKPDDITVLLSMVTPAGE